MTAQAIGEAGSAAIPWVAIIGFLLAIVKVWPSLRKIKVESDVSLRTDLLGRVTALEAKIRDLEEEARRDRERCTEEREALEARHAAEIRVLRHRLNNETAVLDAFFLLMESNPSKVVENLPKIKEMRARKAQEVALERGAMMGGVVSGD